MRVQYAEGGVIISSLPFKKRRGCVKIETSYQSVIFRTKSSTTRLSIAKNLYTSTLCLQILHYIQDDTTL